jgi:acyl-coenzyme A synthetase/AMP-(fatty) acid ligase
MYGFGAEFLPAILAGASIDLQDKTNLLKYLDREKRFRPNLVFATPAICEMLLKGFKTPRTGYQVFVTSGQRISEEMLRAFDPLVGGKLVNQYGSTEMGATAACDTGDPLDDRATTIGAPMGGVELRIENGVLFCRHPYGFEGYLNEDGDWLHREPPGGWYGTGDLAERLSGGRIAVLGRADASVNRSGYLVLLADIERMMEKLEPTGEVAVVPGKGETKQGQRIVAFCVPRGGAVVDGAEVRRLCLDLLPHYAIPDEVRVLETLPLLESGKIDRQALAGLAG